MNITFQDILKNERFYGFKVIAGRKGLARSVKRISVFDCEADYDLINKDIFKEGDLFITCFDQFKEDKTRLPDYFKILFQANSAGLFVVSDNSSNIITPDIINLCDENEYAVVYINEKMPYAEIIDIVHKYVTIETMNTVSSLRLNSIMYDNLPDSRNMYLLNSINPNIKKLIMTIAIDGEFTSDIERTKILFNHVSSDIFVQSNKQIFCVLSEDNEKALRNHMKVVISDQKRFIKADAIGYSQIYPKNSIAKALNESNLALETAKRMDVEVQFYDPLSSVQLLLGMKDKVEAKEFYEAYENMIVNSFSKDSVGEILKTIETFISLSGNYSLTAEKLNQHENTIRYRINKVKEALNMDTDMIKFHETIAIATKLGKLLGK